MNATVTATGEARTLSDDDRMHATMEAQRLAEHSATMARMIATEATEGPVAPEVADALASAIERNAAHQHALLDALQSGLTEDLPPVPALSRDLDRAANS